ncbi:hypothetical protein [Metallosphaera hakonensis]|nr:hypothetical protein [Metallosphaera hakonensis]
MKGLSASSLIVLALSLVVLIVGGAIMGLAMTSHHVVTRQLPQVT